MFAKLLRSALLTTAVGALFICVSAETAHAQLTPADRGYIGNAYLQIPGVNGGWRGEDYRGSARVDAHYWQRQAAPPAPRPQAAPAAQRQQTANRGQGQQQQGGGILGRPPFANAPAAPRSGEGTLVLAFNKDNPALPAMMERCRAGTVMPEVQYSVSTDRSRAFPDVGPLPSGMPRYFDYTLRNVQFVDCPVVDSAPQQAIVAHFSDISWTNWQSEARGMPVTYEPAQLAPLPSRLTGETRAWVLTWFAMANDVSEEQCPTMNGRPSEADYYALVPPEQAEQERAALAGQGGPNYENGQMSMRGPHRLNATALPGIVPDPGLAEPQTHIARGLNLDGSTNSRQHRNYVSEDGAVTGIDNQLYTVMGCIAGWQGHNGFIMQFANNQMRDGQMSMLVEISGIDDEQNDREVYVTMLYSMEPMAKSGSGAQILRDFTFHVTDLPQFTHYFTRVRARIVDGVVITEPMDHFRLNLGVYGNPPDLQMTDARMRIALQPDGAIRGVLGGYRDWRRIVSTYNSSAAEFYHGFQNTALYNALRRNADGQRNPETGEYDGISTAYDMEGIPAFVVHAPSAIAQAGPGAGSN